MNAHELLQGEMAAMSARMKRLEIVFRSRGVITDDATEAERLAETMGFDIEVVYLPRGAGTKKLAKERKALARKLRTEKRWAPERIARALNCAERSVRRWLA